MIKSCLFLDFDNLFSGLRKQSDIAASNFVKRPMEWLKWLENVDLYDDATEKRTILVRKCYLNPLEFSRYRPYFVQSSFQVIDCPSLTTKGKNSADIYMVLDILTYMEHPTQFDEFIIMSADSDFTPVLVRLRENNRKTIVIASGLSSIAYRNSSDLYFDQAGFIDVLESLSEEIVSPKISVTHGKKEPSDVQLKDEIKAKIEELLQENNQLVLGSLALTIKKMYNVDDTWFGQYKFSKFVESLNMENTTLDLTAPGYLYRETESVVPDVPADTLAAALIDLLVIRILTEEEYQTLFTAIFDFVKDNKYNLSACSKFMRNEANKKGHEISRKTCNYILFGINRSGTRFSPKESIRSYQKGFYDYIKMLIRINQINFTDEEYKKLEAMLGL